MVCLPSAGLQGSFTAFSDCLEVCLGTLPTGTSTKVEHVVECCSRKVACVVPGRCITGTIHLGQFNSLGVLTRIGIGSMIPVINDYHSFSMM